MNYYFGVRRLETNVTAWQHRIEEQARRMA
jgi:hypothetical protein